FTDMGFLNWIYDGRAQALSDLGRDDDAVADLRRAAAMPDAGAVNAANAINLGDALYGLGRPQDAIDAVAHLGPPSPYGTMQSRGVPVGAYRQLGSAAAAREQLATMRAHASDDPRAVIVADLCLGDEDAAAAATIAWLDEPKTRDDALFNLQDFVA